MPVIKKRLSTDMLPPGLSERQRFMFFAELFEHFSNTGELDPAADVPFRAAMNSIHVGTTMLGRCDGTFTTVRREQRQVLSTNDDRYCLARNTGDRDSRVSHRGREFVMRPGSMVLLKLDEPFFAADGTSHKRFTNVHLPMATLKSMVADVDDLVGRELAPGGALSLAMDYSDLLLKHSDAVDEAGFAIAAHLMDLAALGLAQKALAGAEVGCEVGLPAPAEAEQVNRLEDGDAERAHPLDRRFVAVDERTSQGWVAARVHRGQRLEAGSGPDELGVGGRASHPGRLLDQADRDPPRGGTGSGAEAGHPGPDHQQVELGRVAHVVNGSLARPE